MKTLRLVPLFAAVAMNFVSAPGNAQEAHPAWAYPMNPPGFKLANDDGSIRRVPDSTAGYTLTQTRDRFAATDWHPEDHPPMPEVVAKGRKPDVFACGWCHRADGPGAPENANLMGLPYVYIVQQMKDFRSGDRKTSIAKRAPTTLMIAGSKAVSDTDIEDVARYFSSLKPRANYRVVEAAVVPKSTVLVFKPSGVISIVPRFGQSRHETGSDRRRRAQPPMCHLPRPRVERDRYHSANRGSLAKLSGAADS